MIHLPFLRNLKPSCCAFRPKSALCCSIMLSPRRFRLGAILLKHNQPFFASEENPCLPVFLELCSTSQGWFKIVQLVLFSTISQRAKDLPWAVEIQAVSPCFTSPPTNLQVQPFSPAAAAGTIARRYSAMAHTIRIRQFHSHRPPPVNDLITYRGHSSLLPGKFFYYHF